MTTHPSVIEGIFWTTVALMRLCCGPYFVACEIAEYPWDVVDGIPVGGEDPRFEIPGRNRPKWWPDEKVLVTQEGAEFVGSNFDSALILRADRRFQFGLECFTGAFDEQDIRMAISKIWAGIEGVLGISSELRFRIALYCASLAAPAGIERANQFRETTKLYDLRSKVVHGAKLDTESLYRCLNGSAAVLKRLLVGALSRGEVLSTASIEDALLGVT